MASSKKQQPIYFEKKRDSPTKVLAQMQEKLEAKLSHISHRYTLQDNEFEVFSAKFSSDSSYIAVSYADSSVSIYSSMLGDPLYYIRDSEIQYPITAIGWKPTSKTSSDVQTFKAVGADGKILMWRPKYANTMKTLLVSETNSYQCFDYSTIDSGQRFAVAGKLPQVEVYDDETLERICELKTTPGQKGHTNRIFSVKFDPVQPQVLYSGGWDCMVNVWDCRNGKITGSIHGPQICGDAIDVKEDTKVLLTGSYQVKDGLQLWDLRTMSELQKVRWGGDYYYPSQSKEETSQIYSAKFSHPKKDFIIAGGADKNVAKVFQTETGKIISVFTGLNKPCLVTDTANDGSLLLLGCADGCLQIKNFVYS